LIPSHRYSGILTEPSFYHPAFEEAFRFIIDEYQVPERDTGLFLPCSMQKPFSNSPSHILFDKAIFSELTPDEVHIVVFGSCGVVPRELERMYPFTHYRYMFGRCTDPRIKRDFYAIEVFRLVRYLEKTQSKYRRRIAYCLGGFRKAMLQASCLSGIPVCVLPSDERIALNLRGNLKFPQGSLNMDLYLQELRTVLRTGRDRGQQVSDSSNILGHSENCDHLTESLTRSITS
jgi:archaeosine synthase